MIAFQKTIGGDSTEFGWQEQSFRQTIDHENYYTVQKSEDPPESLFPPKFKEIRYWLTFKEEFQAYLRLKRGVNKTPLMYVLREKINVSDIDRDGKVGTEAGDTYPNWDKYGLRCTI